MKKYRYIIAFVLAGIAYFIIKRLFGTNRPDKGLLKILDNITVKSKQNIDKIDKKIKKLEKTKVNTDDFKDYSRFKLIKFIKRKASSGNKHKHNSPGK